MYSVQCSYSYWIFNFVVRPFPLKRGWAKEATSFQIPFARLKVIIEAWRMDAQKSDKLQCSYFILSSKKNMLVWPPICFSRWKHSCSSECVGLVFTLILHIHSLWLSWACSRCYKSCHLRQSSLHATTVPNVFLYCCKWRNQPPCCIKRMFWKIVGNDWLIDA